jgi:hypothetical protein
MVGRFPVRFTGVRLARRRIGRRFENRETLRLRGGISRSVVEGLLCCCGLLHALHDLKHAPALRLLGDLTETRFPNFLDNPVLERLINLTTCRPRGFGRVLRYVIGSVESGSER